MRSALGLGLGVTQAGQAADGGGAPAVERVQNGDFASATGWSFPGATWAIAAGVATNNTAANFLTGTFSQALAAGEAVPVSFGCVANPAATGVVVQLYNSVTLATQTIYNAIPTAGTVNAPGAVASGAFDQIRFRALDDPGLVIDNVSLVA